MQLKIYIYLYFLISIEGFLLNLNIGVQKLKLEHVLIFVNKQNFEYALLNVVTRAFQFQLPSQNTLSVSINVLGPTPILFPSWKCFEFGIGFSHWEIHICMSSIIKIFTCSNLALTGVQHLLFKEYPIPMSSLVALSVNLNPKAPR